MTDFGTPRTNLFFELAGLILRVPTLNDRQPLRRAADAFGERFEPLDLPESGTLREDLYRALVKCDAYQGGLRFYLDALGIGRTGMVAWTAVEQMYLRLHPRRLLDSSEYEELCDLLAFPAPGAPIERIALRFLPLLPERAEGATGPYTVAELLDAFEDALLMPDEAHPLISFVEAVAVRQPPGLEKRLRLWNERVAPRLACAPDLLHRVRNREAFRAGRPVEPSRILVDITAHPAAPEDYWLRGWLLGPGEGPGSLLADRRVTSRSELEHTVAALHQAVGDLLGELSGELTVEFVLPRPLLWLDVDQFMISPNGSVPRPIGADHTVLVRSRDRFRIRRWWPALYRRLGWLELNADELFDAPAVRCVAPGTVPAPEDLLRQLRGGQTPFCFVLLDAPPYEGDLAADPVYVLLEVGIPAIVALRENGHHAHARTELWNHLAGRLDQLPDRVRHLRGGGCPDGGVASPVTLDLHRHLTLVWDSQDGLEGADATLGHPRTGGGRA
ncbi:hypothetical protein [Streptomyces sp. NK08204]|uniref:VMAP-C domain-containing protein n=1 Tax=Streptomyces sp. NK08204 TaxID=2873260 RepID=UPI001CEC08B4|nr:hypothetical protein [Streptomyces sp. NK08204]